MKVIVIIGLLIIPCLNPFKTNAVYISAKVTDKLLLTKLNDYRKYYRLKPVVWNDTIYRIAKYHSDYMERANIVSHFEEVEVPNFQLIYDVRQRFRFYKCKRKGAECVLGGSMIIQFKDQSFHSFLRRIWKVKVGKMDPLERMACQTIYRWHTSKGHREILQSSEYSIGAVSIRYTEIKEFEKEYFLQQ